MNRRLFLALADQSPEKRMACRSSTDHLRSHFTHFVEGYWIGETHHDPPFEVASLWMDQIHPKIAGIDYVGLGYSDPGILQIMGLNLLRVLRQNEEVAKQK